MQASQRSVLAALLFVILPWWQAPASAGTAITVTTTDQVSATDCTLPDAMFSASFDLAFGQCPAGDGADVITITAVGTITLTDALTSITTPMEIHGPGADALTIRRSDAASPFRILFVTADGNATVSGVTIQNGLVDQIGSAGAGVVNFGALVLEDVAVSDNHADISSDSLNPAPSGGGILNQGTMTIRRSSVSANSVETSQTAASGATIAMARGGGLFNTGTLTIERSTISGNSTHAEVTSADPGASARTEGGGILNHGVLTISTSTISGNTLSSAVTSPATTQAFGGGIQNEGTLTLTDSTIASNAAATAANLGALGTETIVGTIIADPMGGADCLGSVDNDNGFNLEFPAGCTGLGAALHLDPNLGPLADNGGATMTHAIPKSSPAVDGATAPDVDGDQRGMPRPYDQPGVANAAGGDGTDIGAFELQDATPPQTTITKAPKQRIETTANRVRVLFRFRSSEPGSEFACRRDGGPWRNCSSPFSYRVGAGRHVFRVEATDQAGNTDPTPARHAFRIVRV